MPRRALLVGLVAVALVASGVAPVAGARALALVFAPLDADPSAATPSVINPSTVNPSIVEQIDEPFDPNTATRIRIEPTSDGDAQWTVSVRYALSDERDRAAFDSVGEIPGRRGRSRRNAVRGVRPPG